MKYKSFTIENYRCIKGPLTVNVEHGGVHPIIGLNDSGKTTILRAISTFDCKNDEIHPENIKNVANKSGTSNEAEITAVIEFSYKDIEDILDIIWRMYCTNEQSIGAKYELEYNYTREEKLGIWTYKKQIDSYLSDTRSVTDLINEDNEGGEATIEIAIKRTINNSLESFPSKGMYGYKILEEKKQVGENKIKPINISISGKTESEKKHLEENLLKDFSGLEKNIEQLLKALTNIKKNRLSDFSNIFPGIFLHTRIFYFDDIKASDVQYFTITQEKNITGDVVGSCKCNSLVMQNFIKKILIGINNYVKNDEHDLGSLYPTKLDDFFADNNTVNFKNITSALNKFINKVVGGSLNKFINKTDKKGSTSNIKISLEIGDIKQTTNKKGETVPTRECEFMFKETVKDKEENDSEVDKEGNDSEVDKEENDSEVDKEGNDSEVDKEGNDSEVDKEENDSEVDKEGNDSEVYTSLSEKGDGFKWYFAFLMHTFPYSLVKSDKYKFNENESKKSKIDEDYESLPNKKKIVRAEYYKYKLESLKNKSGEDPIYLFNEPGCYLHGSAQRQLCDVFFNLTKENNSTVIYNTHTPSLLEEKVIPNILIASKEGNTVELNKLGQKGNTKFDALIPVKMAMGAVTSPFDKEQPNIIIVEGITDFYAFNAVVKEYQNDNSEQDDKKVSYNNIQIVPSTGANNISNLFNWILSMGKNIICLFDNDDKGRECIKNFNKNQDGLDVERCVRIVENNLRKGFFSISIGEDNSGNNQKTVLEDLFDLKEVEDNLDEGTKNKLKEAKKVLETAEEDLKEAEEWDKVEKRKNVEKEKESLNSTIKYSIPILYKTEKLNKDNMPNTMGNLKSVLDEVIEYFNTI